MYTNFYDASTWLFSNDTPVNLTQVQRELGSISNGSQSPNGFELGFIGPVETAELHMGEPDNLMWSFIFFNPLLVAFLSTSSQLGETIKIVFSLFSNNEVNRDLLLSGYGLLAIILKQTQSLILDSNQALLGTIGPTTQTLEAPFMILFTSLDILFYFGEVLAFSVIFIRLSSTQAWPQMSSSFYDDLVTLCKQLGLSFIELACLFSVSLGLLFFDLLLTFAEDDAMENILWALLSWTVLSFIGVYLSVDLFHLFVIAGAGSNTKFLRALYDDILFNSLAFLRLFVCWLRFLFYDFQAEQLDIVLQQSTFVNSHATFIAYGASSILEPATFAAGVWASFGSLFLSIVSIIFELSIWLVLVVISFLKLALALYIYWLLVDVTLFRLMSVSEILGWKKSK